MPKAISPIRNFIFQTPEQPYGLRKESELLAIYAIKGTNAFMRGRGIRMTYGQEQIPSTLIPVQYAFFDENLLEQIRSG
jgi:hypothetical protein